MSAILNYQLSTRAGITGTIGAILGGDVTHTTTEDMGRGVLASVSASYLGLFESDSRPFVLGSVSLGHSRTNAVSDDNRRHTWSATDFRLGVMVGKTIAERFVPYAAARAFGGPVNWRLGGEDVVGTDIYHYAVGGGMSVRLPGQISFFVEAIPLGEQSVSGGLTLPL